MRRKQEVKKANMHRYLRCYGDCGYFNDENNGDVPERSFGVFAVSSFLFLSGWLGSVILLASIASSFLLTYYHVVRVV